MLKSFIAVLYCAIFLNVAIAQNLEVKPASDSATIAPVSPSTVSAPAHDSLSASSGLVNPSVVLPNKANINQDRLFNDPKLLAQEYVFGAAGTYVLGGLSFFIGKGIESLFYTHDKKGTLEFSGVRYDNFHGAFYGAYAGMALGSALTVYFVGQSDEEDGGFWLTTLGSMAATAAGMYVATQLDVNKDVHFLPFVPLVLLPPAGACLGFNYSSWLSDRKRKAITGHTSNAYLLPPTVSLAPSPKGDLLYTFNVLNLKF